MNKTDGRKIDREALDVSRDMAMTRIANGEAVSAVITSCGLALVWKTTGCKSVMNP